MESIRVGLTPLLVVVLTTTGGCTSAISTAYLRDALWEVSDHAAEEGQVGDSESSAIATSAADESGAPPAGATAAAGSEVDAERRRAAIDEAVARLARIGRLDTASKTALVQTLQETSQEDWPVVVDTFAASLEASAASRAAATAGAAAVVEEITATSEHHTVGRVVGNESESSSADVAPEPPAATLVGGEAGASGVAAPPPTVSPPEPPLPESPPAPPATDATRQAAAAPAETFAVRHACFARRVQGWGAVDRFPDSRFAAGQDVIVYVELDNLSAGESPAGHTTCVDATLRLVDDAGRTVHEWTFEPIVETSPTRRHDYFARYVIRIPDAAPVGGCRLALQVVDTLAGRTASTDLPLEVVSRQVATR